MDGQLRLGSPPTSGDAWSQPAPKDDFVLSPAEAVYGSPLALPGESRDCPEFPQEVFLQKVEPAVSGFSGPPRHHVVSSPQPQPLLKSILVAEFVFVRDDTSKPHCLDLM